ncbi:ATPase [Sphaerimonospora thailandensis]|uniref:ATPase n=1 Tax=Sphaerimonospora thailandensis TaxID=795644 RepID=A0A8J3VWN9_9ACTN|nr:ATPase [Sphaerimonospora thailandensis]
MVVEKRLIKLEVENFRSLRKISLPLGPVNVLVGPNGAGKTNVLEVFRFLADMVQTDLVPALEERGGLDEILFRGGDRTPGYFRIGLVAAWTEASSLDTPDEYSLKVSLESANGQPFLVRDERFRFPNPPGWQQIVVSNNMVEIFTATSPDLIPPNTGVRATGISSVSSGLSTLPRLSDEAGAREVRALAEQLSAFRVFDVSVDAARRPSKVPRNGREVLNDNAANLAAFLLALHRSDEKSWQRLEADAKAALPQLDAIEFDYPSGPAREVVVALRERGLRRTTQLADASYGTIRLLGLLALLYDPHPPALTCVEEIDHGLHPQALELLVARIREASERTQFLIATHSPTLADRLRPEELIVCERQDDGSSSIRKYSGRAHCGVE